MEITLEFEDSDIIIGFDPEFDVASNCTDIEKVQWEFQNGTHTTTLASLLRGTPKHGHTPTRLPQIMRLCDRLDEDEVR
jgi:hypothetical protein